MHSKAVVLDNIKLIQKRYAKIILLTSLFFLSGLSWGNCVGNCLNGKGTYTFPDESIYIGQWMYGKFNGQGTFIWPGKGKYVGKWRDGESHGEGIITFADGRRYTGHFSENHIIGLKALDPSLPQSNDTQKLGGKTLIAVIQQQLIDYRYLRGTADGIPGDKTSTAVKAFYRDAEITHPALDDYTTIAEHLSSTLLSPAGNCPDDLSRSSGFSVCFTVNGQD